MRFSSAFPAELLHCRIKTISASAKRTGGCVTYEATRRERLVEGYRDGGSSTAETPGILCVHSSRGEDADRPGWQSSKFSLGAPSSRIPSYFLLDISDWNNPLSPIG